MLKEKKQTIDSLKTRKLKACTAFIFLLYLLFRYKKKTDKIVT